jgi:hypothetical protein
LKAHERNAKGKRCWERSIMTSVTIRLTTDRVISPTSVHAGRRAGFSRPYCLVVNLRSRSHQFTHFGLRYSATSHDRTTGWAQTGEQAVGTEDKAHNGQSKFQSYYVYF